MKTRYFYPVIFAAMSSTGGIAHAQDVDELDVTMELVEEGGRPESIIEPIVLPDTAAAEAVENSARGLATANAARELGRDFGQARAEEARQRGEEARSTVEDNAQEGLARARQDLRDHAREGALEDVPADARENIPDHVRDRLLDNAGRNPLVGEL